MKTFKRLFFTMVLTLLVGVSTSSAVDVIIGTGTSTTSTYPFISNWGGNKTQMIFTASELTTAGMLPGTINSLAFYHTSAGTVPLQNFRIRIKSTTLSAFGTSTFEVGAFTTVYQNTLTPSTLGTTPGWFQITFATPYEWDGANIIVETAWTNNNSGSNEGSTVSYTATSSVYKTLYKNQDNRQTLDDFDPAGTRGYNRPNVRFGYTPTTNPLVSANPNAIEIGYLDPNSTSSLKSFNLSGINLTPAGGNLTITPGTNVALKLTPTSPAIVSPNTLTIPYTEGALSSTPIYASLTSGAEAATYSGQITISGGGLSTPKVINVSALGGNLMSSYCTSNATSDYDQDIGNVSIGTDGSLLNNGSATPIYSNTSAINTYSNFMTSVQAVQLKAGSTYPISVSVINRSTYAYTSAINVYIDYNRNGRFDLPEELAFTVPETGSGNSLTSDTWTGEFTLPVNVNLNGNAQALMRVVIDESDIAPPCDTYTWGETEDYTVQFLPPSLMTTTAIDTVPVPLTSVIKSTENVPVVALNVRTEDALSPFNLKRFVFSNVGTATSSDIENVKVWLSNENEFNAENATLFGTLPTIGTGINTVTNLATNTINDFTSGNNYIYLTYDITDNPTTGHTIDVKIDTLVLSRNLSDNEVDSAKIINLNPYGFITIKEPLNGTYVIGGPVQANKYYSNLLSATEDLLMLGISGDVEFALAANQTLDSGNALILSPVNNVGGEYSITLYPKDAARTITGNVNYNSTSNLGVVTFNGVERFVIDGRVNKTGTNRGLTITNINQDNSAKVISIFGEESKNQNSKDVTVKYTNILGFDKTKSSSAGIQIKGNGIDNIFIDNNSIKKTETGINSTQLGSYNGIKNLQITNNTIGDLNDDANSIYKFGLQLTAVDSVLIEGNSIVNILLSGTGSPAGIELGTYANNVTINNNVIKKIKDNRSYGAFGINISSGGDSNIVITNNRISEILANGTGTFASFGTMGVRIYNGKNLFVYHNTVVLEGDRSSIPGATVNTNNESAALYYGASASNLDLKNNIFINRTTNTANKNAYSIYLESTSNIPTINYNNYFVDPLATAPVLAYISGEMPTLANIKTVTSQDANSKNINVGFTEDFHLDGSSAMLADLMVMPLTKPSALKDMDNLNRQTAPKKTQMGADEAIANISITQDLPEKIEGLCAPTEQVLTVKAEITGFSDNITREILTPVFNYQWKKDGAAVNNELIEVDPETGDITTTVVNSNKFTVIVDKATPRQGVNYSVTVSGGGKTFDSKIANIKAEEVIVVNEQPLETAELCTENGVTTLTVEATGTISGYQWQKEINGTWTNLSGETKKSVEVVLGSPKFGPGKYRVIIYDGESNCSNGQVVSDISTLTAVDPLRDLVLQSDMAVDNKIEVCEGVSISVKVDKELLTGDVFDFRWEQLLSGVWGIVDPESRPELTIDGFEFNNAVPEQSGTYRLVLIGSSLCDTKELTSEAIEVVIKPFVKVLNQPRAQIVCKDNPIVLEVKAEGDNATYQWTKDGKPITAEENATFDKPVFKIENADFEDSGVYGVMVQVLGCVPGRDDGVLVSEPATVYVMNETQIISQPVNQHAILGKRAIFEVRTNAIGAAPDYIADFQWYNGNQKLEDNAKYAGAKSSVLVINYAEASDATAEYHLRIKGLCGDYLYTDKVHIIPATVAFTEQLSDVSACENELVTYKVAAETTYPNEEITYEWHFVNSEGTDQVLSSSTSNEISILAIEANAGKYYALAKLLNDGASVKSNESLLKVNTKPVITEAFEAATVAANESFTLTVLASGNDLEYKWYRDGAIIANAVSASFTGQEANAGTYDYRVEVINSCGTVSTAADVTVTAEPKVEVIEPILGVFVSNVIPNPVVSSTASFTVNSDKAYQMTVSLIDAAGRNYGTLFDGTLSSSQEVTFNVNDLTSGAYYLNININGKVITRQIIVSK